MIGCSIEDFGLQMSDFNFGMTKNVVLLRKTFGCLNLYIIAGCNGAGKTTASYTVLPEMLNCKEFVNEFAIAMSGKCQP